MLGTVIEKICLLVEHAKIRYYVRSYFHYVSKDFEWRLKEILAAKNHSELAVAAKKVDEIDDLYLLLSKESREEMKSKLYHLIQKQKVNLNLKEQVDSRQ